MQDKSGRDEKPIAPININGHLNIFILILKGKCEHKMDFMHERLLAVLFLGVMCTGVFVIF